MEMDINTNLSQTMYESPYKYYEQVKKELSKDVEFLEILNSNTIDVEFFWHQIYNLCKSNQETHDDPTLTPTQLQDCLLYAATEKLKKIMDDFVSQGILEKIDNTYTIKKRNKL